MKYPNLIAEMARIKINKTDIAKALGVSAKTVYFKIQHETFLYKEVIKIQETFFPELPVDYLFSSDPVREVS